MTPSASRRRWTRRGAALLLPLSAAACGAGDGGTADAFTVRDSARIRAYAPEPARPSRWWVFSGEGRLLGTVTTPSRFVVQEIGTDYVVGVWRDEMDVQYLHRYTLHKPRG